MNSYFSIVFLLTFRVSCSDTRCTLILLSPKYSMATYFDPDRQSNVDYTNVKKVLDDDPPDTPSDFTFASVVHFPVPVLFLAARFMT